MTPTARGKTPTRRARATARKGTLKGRIVAFASKAALLAVLFSVAVVGLLRWVPPPTTAFMLESSLAASRARRSDYITDYRWTPWRAISPYAKLAVIAAEDQRFAQHAGFDFDAMLQAVKTYADGGRLRGASTLSQQVAKNLFLWSGKNIGRKLMEAYFTAIIELLWPKRRILEVYLNIAEFGPGIYGVEAAAQRFFHKPAAALGRAESALLAAVLPNPKKYDVRHPGRYVRRRQRWILAQMSNLGGRHYLTQLSGD
jgi:monofunctional biosynthetic peptidoglycan transglycosylase